MTVMIIILIGIIIFLAVIRFAAKDNAEKSGLDKCPKCHKKMELGAMGRYNCPHCGYKQGHGYF
jgi:ribosomal protein L37AE/L43A